MKAKRIISVVLCSLMILSLIPVAAFAEIGPFRDYIDFGDGGKWYPAFGAFFELDENGENVMDPETEAYVNKAFFREGQAVGEMPGAAYDCENGQNVLHLDNLDASNYLLDANMLGEDFTIEVNGTCKLGGIMVWGDGWGGSLDIQGDGTLIVNENKTRMDAILMYPEGAPNFSLSIGKKVNVDLYAPDDGHLVYVEALEKDDEHPFRFINEEPEFKVDPAVYTHEVGIEGYYDDDTYTESGGMKVVNANDPDGIYGASEWTHNVDEPDEYVDVHITKYIYSPTFEIYFADNDYEIEHQTGDGSIEYTYEELANSEYSIVYENDEPVWNNIKANDWLLNETVYVDHKGGEYVLHTVGYDDDGNDIEKPYIVTPIPEIEGAYYFTPAGDEVNPENLFEKVETEQHGYIYTVEGTEYHYAASDAPDVEIKLIDIGTVWTNISAGDTELPFTTEINPNEPGLTDQIYIVEQGWIKKDTGEVYATEREGVIKPFEAGEYEFGIRIGAKPGYTIPEEFTFIYGGTDYTDKIEKNSAGDGSSVAITGFLTITVSDGTGLPFTDVPTGAWFTNGVRYCYDTGLMTGTSNTTFSPNMNFSRSMFVTVLYRIDGSAPLDDYKGKTSFNDVKANDWFAPYVEWAYRNNYASGTGGGNFGPNAPVTRETLAQFFYNYSSKKGFDVTAADDLERFADKDQISGWALNAVKWAVACELISGTSATTVSPKATATRAQVAVIAAKYDAGVKAFEERYPVPDAKAELWINNMYGSETKTASLVVKFDDADLDKIENVRASIEFPNKDSRDYTLKTENNGETYIIDSGNQEELATLVSKGDMVLVRLSIEYYGFQVNYTIETTVKEAV